MTKPVTVGTLDFAEHIYAVELIDRNSAATTVGGV